MQAQTHSPAGIFGHHIRYVVPLFQRPYVWTEDDQWRPLWDDVRTVTERLLEAPPATYGSPPVAPHFLGAIVLDQQSIPSGFIAVRHVIDGQQRLTTLQLLLDAAQWVVEQHGAAMDAQALRVLVLNDPSIAQHPDHVFKVWPTDRDQDAFRASMDNNADLSADLTTSRIAQAHQFFVTHISDWAEAHGDQHISTQRLNALVRVLRDHLKIVVIDLEPGDNAQVIFETLNHRGSRLLAADLVKNLVFQIAQSQNADVEDLYRTYWKPLDSDYWRQLVAQGRRSRPRIDVFLNYWLTMKLLREVPADRVFADFRDHIVTKQPAIAGLLAEIGSDAEVYAQMENLPSNTAEGTFHYRVIRALDSAAVTPFLLWLLRWDPSRMPLDQRNKAISAVESWIVRRALSRATAKDVNRLVLDLLRALDSYGPEVAGDTVEGLLAAQRAESRYWPSDDALHRALDDEPLYRNLTRPRLRMLLEALENSLRGSLGEGQPCPRNLTVEHIMPQAWREHWSTDVYDESTGLRRDRLVHSLGNLTLVNGKLNPTLSNRPWIDSETTANEPGNKGKRDYLLRHSELKLNATVVAEHETLWNEQVIHGRGVKLVEQIAAIWPRPATAAHLDATLSPQPVDESTNDIDDDIADDSKIASHVGKFRALWQWLRQQDREEIRLDFVQVEEILGIRLPPSARVHLPHWYGYKGTALGRAIRDANWKASHVDLVHEKVTFIPTDVG